MLRGGLGGIYLRQVRGLHVTGTRQAGVVLTPRRESKWMSKQRRKHVKQRELLQWPKYIERNLNDDECGVGFWSESNARRDAGEQPTRLADATEKNANLLQQLPLDHDTVLSGSSQLDRVVGALRARYVERMYTEEREEARKPLTKDVEALYALAVEEIHLCDEAYYGDDPNPRVPDRLYDELVMHLVELERMYPKLVRKDSPTQVVGHATANEAGGLVVAKEGDGEHVEASKSARLAPTRSFKQSKHHVAMLSLSNAYSELELKSFAKRIEDAEVCVEPKIDGVALSLHYKHRKLVLAITRGNGRIGDDVTDNIRAGLIGRGIPESLPDDAPPKLMIVRGEVFISPEDFKVLQDDSETHLSNARNCVAGAIKHKDAAEVSKRRPRFVAYDCITCGDDVPRSFCATQHETLSNLAEWGFGAMPSFRVVSTLKEAELYAAELEAARDKLPFEADGVVLKVDDSEKRAALGTTAKSPRGAIALKFTARSGLTTVIGVRMQISRTGVVTPVAELAPVTIGGATIRRATLHNFDEVKRLDVAVGDVVMLERGGDVIPKIIRVETNGTCRIPICAPTKCPCCDGPVTMASNDAGNTTVSCTNAMNCGGQNLGRLIHFVARGSMDITGLGKKTASKLLDSGLVVHLGDLFAISTEELLEIDGIKEKTANSLYENIQHARTSRSLERFIIALGIPGVGSTSARALALKAINLDGLRQLISPGSPFLLSTPNVAEKSAERIATYLGSARVQAELEVLAKHVELNDVVDNPDLLAEKNVAVQGIKISGKRFVLTGTLNAMPRSAAVEKIKGAGGIVVSALSNKTDYLIAGAEPGAKFHRAQRLGVSILDEEDLQELFLGRAATSDNTTEMHISVAENDVGGRPEEK